MITVGLILVVLLILVILNIKSLMYNRFRGRFEYVQQSNDLPVDMVYCISMPQRIEYVTKQMKEIGTSYKLFHAISPQDLTTLDYLMFSTTLIPGTHLYKKFTKLPVILSFFMCYYDAWKNGYDSICILEDDIILKESVQNIRTLIHEFNATAGVDILYMGYCWLDCRNPEQFKQISPSLRLVPNNKRILCNHAMVLNKDLIDRYMRQYNLFLNNINNDTNLDKFLKDNTIPRAVPTHGYIDQNYEKLGSNNENDNSRNKTCIIK